MKRSGFTLAELLLAIFFSAAACAIAMLGTKQALDVMERISARALAWERGQNALSIIEPRVLNAGLGITCERAGDVFRRSFGGASNSPPPARWADPKPLQIWDGSPLSPAPDDGGVFRGRGIAILYAVPGSLRAEIDAPLHLSAGLPAAFKLVPGAPDVRVSGIANRLPVTNIRDLRSWVTFPLTRVPLHAVYLSGKLVVTAADAYAGGAGVPVKIYPYDEIHYLRAERFYTLDETMYSEELRTFWTQVETRLEGVLEMWFQWTPSKKLLEAWILTTGGLASPRNYSGARPAGWPDAAPWDESFGLHDTAVARGSWILKNM